LLGTSFEISIALQDAGIACVAAMRSKDAMQAAEDTVFPVDERAVTIEGKNFESVEVEHDATFMFCL
jgi:hypothetical protein